MTPNINVTDFFKHFERIVEEKRNNELVCEYEARHKLPHLIYNHSPILVQLSQIYTPAIFDKFRNEFSLFLAACIEKKYLSQLPCHHLGQYGRRVESYI